MSYSVFKLTSAGSLNLTPIGNSPNMFCHGWVIYNTAAAARFVKLYWGAPGTFRGGGDMPTVGTDIPALTIGIPATTSAQINLPDGVGNLGYMFMATTVNAADTDATAVTAGDLILSIFYG